MSTLDATAIALLRGADSACIQYRGEGETTIEGSSGDHRFCIEVQDPLFTTYGPGGPVERVSWPLLYAKHHKGWQTFVSLLRKGDEVRPVVAVNNTSPAVDEANVAVNELAIEIFRPVKGRTAPKVLHFALDTEVYVRRAVRVGNVRRGTR